MEKAIGQMRKEFASVRTGRANPMILDKVLVDYYGTPSAIQAVANVSVPEARMIQIQPWESKMIKEIERNNTRIKDRKTPEEMKAMFDNAKGPTGATLDWKNKDDLQRFVGGHRRPGGQLVQDIPHRFTVKQLQQQRGFFIVAGFLDLFGHHQDFLLFAHGGSLLFKYG